MQLRDLVRLVGLALVAGGVGVALGVGLSALSGDEDLPGSADIAPTATSRGSTTRSTATTRTTRTVATTTTTARPAAKAPPREQVRVTVISAVLHPASTPAGVRRRRARLGVRIKIENRADERVTLARPSLLAANQRVETNPRADAPDTRVDALEAARSAEVTLRFETVGAVTEQLTTQKTARIVVAGRSWPVTVVVGTPARDSRAGDEPAP